MLERLASAYRPVNPPSGGLLPLRAWDSISGGRILLHMGWRSLQFCQARDHGFKSRPGRQSPSSCISALFKRGAAFSYFAERLDPESLSEGQLAVGPGAGRGEHDVFADASGVQKRRRRSGPPQAGHRRWPPHHTDCHAAPPMTSLAGLPASIRRIVGIQWVGIANHCRAPWQLCRPSTSGVTISRRWNGSGVTSADS